ncbi:MAG: hypothetical protein KBT14_02695, partial [Proteobacteria bacterium]|nr:hypothetical protein [Candidatus Enterousia onthequi]
AKTKGYKILALRGEVSQKNLGFWYTMHKGKKLRNSKEKLPVRESKKMHKKHIFLRVFSKIAIFACVFCTISAWAETTTCDIDYTPVTGNSIQNGTPTPENPVDVISVGDRTVNLLNVNDKVSGELNGATGVINTSAIYYTSDYIDISNLTDFTISFTTNITGGAGRDIAYYDSNKTFVSGTRNAITTSKPITISKTFTKPSNAVYVRFTWLHDYQGTPINDYDIMIEEGSTAPTSYVPYGYQIPVAGTSANGSRTTTSVYLNAPLRKVGDYADVLDYKNGTITRNVGVKVLDGTENWNTNAFTDVFSLQGSSWIPSDGSPLYCSHFNNIVLPITAQREGNSWFNLGRFNIGWASMVAQGTTAFKQWLAQQYANGTPVTVYYPLATPVVEQIENWSCPAVPITDIKIATTKMVDDEFAAAEANLAATVQTIESVVSRTITQTGQIQVLQDTKQTRPDENCPANMKCLLVQDEDGTPHWYPIIEP